MRRSFVDLGKRRVVEITSATRHPFFRVRAKFAAWVGNIVFDRAEHENPLTCCGIDGDPSIEVGVVVRGNHDATPSGW